MGMSRKKSMAYNFFKEHGRRRPFAYIWPAQNAKFEFTIMHKFFNLCFKHEETSLSLGTTRKLIF
jgi:hypothetical protein